jgi:hypothetical protein
MYGEWYCELQRLVPIKLDFIEFYDPVASKNTVDEAAPPK